MPSSTRAAAYMCPACSDDHTDVPANEQYRATVLASERITGDVRPTAAL
ncbi:MAG: hypothetical protein ABEL04_10435 [Salinibacter sp.]